MKKLFTFVIVLLLAAANMQAQEKEGYSLRTNLNYRNKSLNEGVPTGE